MPIAEGNTVTVHYVGTLEDGGEFDRSSPDAPLVFRVGQGRVIPGFEAAVLGRERGDAFTVTIPPEEAYGLPDPALQFQVPLAQAPANLRPEPGMLLHVSTDQGELEVLVAAVEDGMITLDANHPLAGRALTFALTIENVE